MAIQDVLNPFVWGQGGAQLTPEQIAQRQAVAKGLLSSAIDTSPTAGGWASVLAKTLAGGMAGYDMRRADDATTQNAKDSQSIIARMLGGMAAGGTPAPAATPGVAPSSSSIPMPGAAGEMAATSPGISAPDNIKSLIASNVPSDMQPYVTNLIDKESGFDPNAVSPTGATGLAQFTRGTGRQYGLISDQGDIRKDPVANLNALVALTNDNRAGLTQALGRAPTDGELALAHQQGLQGAIDLLSGKAVPAGNLAVNNIDPNSDPRTAANKIMQFYGGAGGASAGTQVAQVAQASAPAAPVTQSINPAIIQALSNPYISDQARSVAEALLQRDLKQQDPSYQANLAYTRAQTDALSRKSDKVWQRLDNTMLFDPSTGDIKRLPIDPNQPPADLGLQPQYGVDEAGNPVILQLGKDGKAIQSQLPAGIHLSKEPIKLDAGDHYVLIDPITRQPVGTVQKDLGAAERDKKAGGAEGTAQAALPAIEGAANQMLSSIDSLASDPYLPQMLGPINSRKWNFTGDSERVKSKMDQITGQSFLQAYNTLRGGGQITEVEGQKATAAMARLNAAQNEQDYRDALNELRGIVSSSVQRARQQAGGKTDPQPAASSPDFSKMTDDELRKIINGQ